MTLEEAALALAEARAAKIAAASTLITAQDTLTLAAQAEMEALRTYNAAMTAATGVEPEWPSQEQN